MALPAPAGIRFIPPRNAFAIKDQLGRCVCGLNWNWNERKKKRKKGEKELKLAETNARKAKTA